jgi:sialic acid synthase SpsE/mannose-6-phosphate isomerase-like protein (cupin superfamily)
MVKGERFKNLFIFELANNHMGELAHGLRVVREVHAVAKKYDLNFGFKLQYRDLDTFIHPAYKHSEEFKYVKRFLSTRLSEPELKTLKDEIHQLGFTSICTPFDENSVGLIEKQSFDVIKVASCSLTDWPLLERIAKTDRPVILSTAGATQTEIDKVVSFFEHRGKEFCLMHCVGEYPTKTANLALGQIGYLKARYPGLAVGYSTHEQPDNYDAVKLAVAGGATVFERHVGLKTEKYPLNDYSSGPEQIDRWLAAASEALAMMGVSDRRRDFSDKESADLRGLKRGVFAKQGIKAGEVLGPSNIFFAIPNLPGQLLANDLSKYAKYLAKQALVPDQAVMLVQVDQVNLRERVQQIVNRVRQVIIDSKILLPNKIEFELSHHYGIERFEEWGAAIINCINREYCKKIIVLLPGQKHPVHYHIKKEETFQILYGDVTIEIAGETKEYKPGDIVVVERGVKHSFRSRSGAVFEEVSTTHFVGDSIYDEPEITANKNRKTEMTFWSDWLNKPGE